MKKLRFFYEMKLSFSEEASDNHFTLRVLPLSGHGQEVESLSYSVQPSDYLSEGTDGLGNRYLYGGLHAPHTSLLVRVEGIVNTGKERKMEEEHPLEFLYRRQTSLTKPGERILSLSRRLGDMEDPLAYALYASRGIQEELVYQKGITRPETKAEEALEGKRGVCQDFSHILLSLLREKRIPSRYVAGLVVGEGETHAWVEVLTPRGWVGVDPTNASLVDDKYITFSTGADAKDCLLNKGIIHLNGTQTLEAKAKTEIMEQ